MNQEKRIVAGYIEQVERARARDGSLKDTDLHSIAVELGLSEADLARVDAIAADHLTRGQGYLDHGLLDEAIEELTLAAGLRPLSAEAALALAGAYAARWHKEARTADQRKATDLARRSLALSPDSTEAYALLGSLKQPRVTRSVLAGAIASVVLVGLLVGGVMLGLNLEAPVEAPDGAEVVAAEETVAVEEPAAASPGPLAFEFISLEGLSGLGMDARGSRLTEYPESTAFNLRSELLNDTDQVLREATAELTLTGEDGAVLYQHTFSLLRSHQPRIRPGDRHPFYHLVHLSPLPDGYTTPRQATVRLVSVEADPAAADYPTPEPLPLGWSVHQPGYIDLTLHQRSSTQRPRSDGSVFHRGEYEIRSSPESGTIELLKLGIEYRDASGAQLGTDETYVVTSSGPTMLPGTARLLSFIEPLSTEAEEIRISVVEIR